ncbi:MAG: amidase domain-containing protein, partial [Clostridium sp.]
TNKFDNITFQEIESIFIKKLKNLDLKLDKGTQEYKEYLFNYLMGKEKLDATSDEKKLIAAYAANYIEATNQIVSKGINMTSSPSIGINSSLSQWYGGKVKVGNVANPDREAVTTTWIRATDFNYYWKQRVATIQGRYKGDIIPKAKIGDVIQYREGLTNTFWHTVFVSGKTSNDLRITQHSISRKDDLWNGTVGPIPDSNGHETYFVLLRFA